MTDNKDFNNLVEVFESIHLSMQSQASRAVNSALVIRNWLFGWYIVEFEEGGKDRSELYGKELIKKSFYKANRKTW